MYAFSFKPWSIHPVMTLRRGNLPANVLSPSGEDIYHKQVSYTASIELSKTYEVNEDYTVFRDTVLHEYFGRFHG